MGGGRYCFDQNKLSCGLCRMPRWIWRRSITGRSDLLLYLTCHKDPKWNCAGMQCSLGAWVLAVWPFSLYCDRCGTCRKSLPLSTWLLISIVMQGRTGCGTIPGDGPWVLGKETRAPGHQGSRTGLTLSRADCTTGDTSFLLFC